MEGTLYRIVFPRSSSYAAYSSCLGLLYILQCLIVRLVRFVLLLLLFNFVMHCIISTVVVAFEINYLSLLSRRSRQRERLSASILYICSSVCLSVKMQKNAIFSKTKPFIAMVSIGEWRHRKSYMGFSENPYGTPKIQDGWDPPSWKSTWRHFIFVARCLHQARSSPSSGVYLYVSVCLSRSYILLVQSF